jgi:hypothetical protein
MTVAQLVNGILRILWNPNVHYRAHKSRPLDHTLIQLNPVHTFTRYFFLRYIFNIILSSLRYYSIAVVEKIEWCFSCRRTWSAGEMYKIITWNIFEIVFTHISRLVRRKCRLKECNILAIPSLLHGRVIRTMKQIEKKLAQYKQKW